MRLHSVEVLVAISLIVVFSVGVVRLFVVAASMTRSARDRTIARSLAAGKLEQLRSLTWEVTVGPGGTMVEASDGQTNLSVTPPGAGGPGLNEAPPGTLDAQRSALRRLFRSPGGVGRRGPGAARKCGIYPPLGRPPRAHGSGPAARVPGARHDCRARTCAPARGAARVERRRGPGGHDEGEGGEMKRLRGEGGFSLVEMLVATAIVCGAFALVFQFTASAQRAARAVPDASDMQQRLRVAADAIRATFSELEPLRPRRRRRPAGGLPAAHLPDAARREEAGSRAVVLHRSHHGALSPR